jgi:hypothetical protein
MGSLRSFGRRKGRREEWKNVVDCLSMLLIVTAALQVVFLFYASAVKGP